MQPVVHETECDGIDNDFDGYIDANDKSEFKNIRFYSPDFDYKDSLITEAVAIDFEINDNIQQYVKDPNLLQWRIYMVGGNDLDTTTDRLVFRKEITGQEAMFPVKVNDCWRFEPYNRHISPPDGIYAMVILCKDQAENSIMSIPAYFIIDKQEPTITVIRDWQDERGRKEFNDTSAVFGCLYKPGTNSGYFEKYDSETDRVEVEFFPVGIYHFLVEPFTTTVFPIYDDHYTVTAEGEIDLQRMDLPDGLVDPSRIYIPNVKFDLRKQYRIFSLDAINLPDDRYKIRLIAYDKAGNSKIYYNDTQIITVKRGEKNIELIPTNWTGDSLGTDNDDNGNKILYSKKDFQRQNDKKDSTNDEGAIEYQEIRGDFEFTTKVIDLDTGDNSYIAFGGIMVREKIDANSVMIALVIDNNGNGIIRYRSATGDHYLELTIPDSLVTQQPWLKVKRTGSTLEFLISKDGINYTSVYSTTYSTEPVIAGVYFEHNSTDAKKITFRYGFGSDPFNDGTVLESYTLFAKDTIKFADRARVYGRSGAGKYFEIGVNAVNYGNLTCGGNLYMRDGATVEGIAKLYGTLIKQNLFSIDSLVQNTPVQSPSITERQFNTGTQDTIIPVGATVTLEPGMYKDLHAYANSTIILNAGTYYFNKVVLESDVNVTVNVGTEKLLMNVKNSFSMGDRCRLTSPIPIDYRQIQIYNQGTDMVRIGCQTYFNGCVIAPNATVEISTQYHNGANFIGTVYAKNIIVHPDVTIQP